MTRLVAACAALAMLLAGCSDVVRGAGRSVASAPAPARPTGCPRVEYPAAKLSFDCITTGMSSFYQGPVWPVSERKVVERGTNWVLEEGGGHWGSPVNQSLATIAVTVRQQMISIGGYGADPKVGTGASRPTTVDGHRAYLLQTTFTINPRWARSDGTRVKQEKLWIIAIEVGPGDVSLWYASVPDLTSDLWPKVPGIIASIKVG
jgi:predicted small secreted protein